MPYDLINEAAELMNWHIDSNGKMDVCPRECPLPEDTRPLCTECTYKTVLHRIAALVDVVEMVRTTPVISGGFRYKTDYEIEREQEEERERAYWEEQQLDEEATDE